MTNCSKWRLSKKGGLVAYAWFNHKKKMGLGYILTANRDSWVLYTESTEREASHAAIGVLGQESGSAVVAFDV